MGGEKGKKQADQRDPPMTAKHHLPNKWFWKKNAAVEFDKLKKESHEANKQVRKGAYCAIITDAKQQFNLPDDAKLS